MAKKRKSSRPSPKASKTQKKAATKKKTASKPRKAPVKKRVTGLESYAEVDFRPLKTQMRAHIERLGKVKEPSPAVANALRALQRVSDELNAECSPTMVIPTP